MATFHLPWKWRHVCESQWKGLSILYWGQNSQKNIWSPVPHFRHRHHYELWFMYFLFQFAFIVWAKAVNMLWSAFFLTVYQYVFLFERFMFIFSAEKKIIVLYKFKGICSKQFVSFISTIFCVLLCKVLALYKELNSLFFCISMCILCMGEYTWCDE